MRSLPKIGFLADPSLRAQGVGSRLGLIGRRGARKQDGDSGVTEGRDLWRRTWSVTLAGAKLTGLLLLLVLCVGIVAGMWWILTLPYEPGSDPADRVVRSMPIFWIVAGTALTIRVGVAISRWWREYLAAVPIVRLSIAITKFTLKFLAALAGLAVAVPILWAFFPIVLRAFGALSPGPAADFDFLTKDQWQGWKGPGLLLYMLAVDVSCIALCAHYVIARLVSLRKRRAIPQ